MARIFITGSADGLGQLAANALNAGGHTVVLHARNEARGKEALAKSPGAETVLIADLSKKDETVELAHKVNALGRFDAIIHNAALYHAPGTELLPVNTLAPYILTCLIQKPERLIYISSDLHEGGRTKFENFYTETDNINYSDTKLHLLMLCKAVARRWPEVYSNALNPGWVPTKMGGAGAPDDLTKGYETQVWLAISNDEKAKVSGKFFYHQTTRKSHPEADSTDLQEEFLQVCEKLTGIKFPQ